MSQANRCPECGAELPASSPQGLCPACLLKRSLETNTAGFTAEDANASRWTPPTVDQLSGKFPELEIIRLIGRGGMGAVYQARQKNLDRVVALKILPPEIGRDPAFAERFAREAQAMARLSHPHIVTIHEFGQRQGLYYFIMEYVDGVSLRGLLDTGHVSPKEALAIVPQICDALQYAHDQGIVHRDIKPENILLNKQGQVKIADFGLAKLMGKRAGAPEQVMGTPRYMAPEQISRPAEVDHRADIYSLGVVFYQMLTGELPKGSLEPPSHIVQIDVRLDEIVLRALQKEPERRYQQASVLKTQVETVMQTPPSSAADSGSSKIPAAVSSLSSNVPASSRFSRVAIAGAAWIPWAFLFLLGMFSHHAVTVAPGTPPPGPSPLQIITLIAIGSLGLTAPFGATICGIVSISQIRRSGDRLYGLALAVLDALFYPLLILNGLVFYGCYKGFQVFDESRVVAPGVTLHSSHATWSYLAGVAISAVIDWVIVRAVWRASKAPLNDKRGFPVDQPPNSSQRPATPVIGYEPLVKPPPVSRLAIIGAIWAGEAILAFLWLTAITGEPAGEWHWMSDVERLGFVLTEASLILGALSLPGTTILGWIALVKIQRSHGRLRGVGLALFDALFIPLLALTGLLIWFWRWVFLVLLYPHQIVLRPGGPGPRVVHVDIGTWIQYMTYFHGTLLIALATLASSAVVWPLLIRWIWRRFLTQKH